MCCALACGTKCLLISGAHNEDDGEQSKDVLVNYNWSLAEAQEFLIYRNTEINGY